MSSLRLRKSLLSDSRFSPCPPVHGRSYCGCHNSAITCDGIGPTKMTSGWIYKLRKLMGFMTSTSPSLVPPWIPLDSKPLTTFCYGGESWSFSFGPECIEEGWECLSNIFIFCRPPSLFRPARLLPSGFTHLRGASLRICRRSSKLGQNGRQGHCREVP